MLHLAKGARGLALVPEKFLLYAVGVCSVFQLTYD